jgi:hypothetical protein
MFAVTAMMNTPSTGTFVWSMPYGIDARNSKNGRNVTRMIMNISIIDVLLIYSFIKFYGKEMLVRNGGLHQLTSDTIAVKLTTFYFFLTVMAEKRRHAGKRNAKDIPLTALTGHSLPYHFFSSSMLS